MPCYSSPEEWERVHAAIHELMARVAESRIPRAEAEEMLSELGILHEDLCSFKKNDVICWEEFWVRIQSIKKRLEVLGERHDW